MRALCVLYDERCPLCIRSARWLQAQEAFLPLETLAAGSVEARRRFGDALAPGAKELTVIDDRGGVYRGTDAWLMCLFALVDYRQWALRLAAPSLKPLARTAFEALSVNRGRVSRLLWAEEAAFREGLAREQARGEEVCDGEGCRIIDAAPV